MTTLILAGETIVAASDDVQTYPWGFEADGVHYPDAAGVTGVATVPSLPADFRSDRYVWRAGALVRLLDPPPPPAPVPSSITRRQLILGLLAAGWITPAEAEAAATGGAPPAALDAVLANLTEADALEARITWATMSVAERFHPLLVAIVAAGIATDAQVDNLFRASVTL
jgi:hypothetical protein